MPPHRPRERSRVRSRGDEDGRGDALEHIAAKLERLRLLREHELGARVEDEEGSLHVRPVDEARM